MPKKRGIYLTKKLFLLAFLLFLLVVVTSQFQHVINPNKLFSHPQTPMNDAGYGTLKDTCPKYGFVKEGIVQVDGSVLNVLNAEITNIMKTKWALQTPELRTMLNPDNHTVYPGKKTFHVGDCITVFYTINRSGKSVVTQVTAQ